ncbi:hypothetical protein CTA1_9868 [Colletotrichum tanaceti]|uniref:Uncharacterized protein n=1 Tax=Colletotrichum tanaceti TaxID=1306861 RepID=A0A4U6XJL4_9PEZI|nr:hypothetical protein CTA1_9868 [Colletotrichum tanaceti]
MTRPNSHNMPFIKGLFAIGLLTTANTIVSHAAVIAGRQGLVLGVAPHNDLDSFHSHTSQQHSDRFKGKKVVSANEPTVINTKNLKTSTEDGQSMALGVDLTGSIDSYHSQPLRGDSRHFKDKKVDPANGPIVINTDSLKIGGTQDGQSKPFGVDPSAPGRFRGKSYDGANETIVTHTTSLKTGTEDG